MIVLISYINLSNLSWIIKCIFLRNLEPSIQRYFNKSFHFKTERLTEILQLSGVTFYDCFNIIYQFIKSFLDNKMSIFEVYRAFKNTTQ